MKTYQYILLDWDGNLAKTLDLWLEVCHIVLKKRGHDLTDVEIASSFGAFIPFMKNLGIEDPEKVMDEADDMAKEKLPNVELYPDALEVLEYLHDLGKSLALLTSSPSDNISFLLKKYNLDRFFRAVITANDTEHHKPDPEPIHLALEKLGGTLDMAVIVGDSDKDLGAAQNAGIDSILFYPPEHQKFYNLDQLKELRPTHIIEDFRELKNLIK